MIRAADYIVDIGPEAGEKGGEVVFSGTLPSICSGAAAASRPTYLAGRRSIAVPPWSGAGATRSRCAAPANTTCATSTCAYPWAS